MSLLKPQPDHRSVWPKQRHLCLGGGTKGAQTKGTPQLGNHRPQTQPGMGLSPPSPWQLPPRHLSAHSTLQEALLSHNGSTEQGCGCACACTCVCAHVRVCMCVCMCVYNNPPPIPLALP